MLNKVRAVKARALAKRYGDYACEDIVRMIAMTRMGQGRAAWFQSAFRAARPPHTMSSWDAGLSVRQSKTALRLANIPKARLDVAMIYVPAAVALAGAALTPGSPSRSCSSSWTFGTRHPCGEIPKLSAGR